MSKKDKPPKTDAPPNVQRGAGVFGLRKMLAGLAGAELCYGEPVRAGERMVIPVSRVSAYGGGGSGGGSSESDTGHGEGWGGSLDAAPVGFIEIGPEGARFESIPDPIGKARALRTGAGAVATGFALLATLRRARRLGAGGSAARRLLSR